MRAMHLTRRFLLARLRHVDASRTLLTPAFSLDDDWQQRHAALKALGIGNDYEWIASVQKKFVGGGIASAIDVDAAVCIADEPDQLDDVISVLYKLRHTNNAAEMLESSEYALVRLLLKQSAYQRLLAVIADPINYGVFLNEHATCLAIDRLLSMKDIPGAARVASEVMIQEMFDNRLVNLMAVYSCVLWTELPREQRVFDSHGSASQETSEDGGEDEPKTFRYPYLKNRHFDGHFDLTNANHRVGKTLQWIATHSRSLEHVPDLHASIACVGALFYDQWNAWKAMIAEGSILPEAIVICREKIEANIEAAGDAEENRETVEKNQELLNALPAVASAPSRKLSEVVLEELKRIQPDEEKALMEKQKDLFQHWNKRRRELIDVQTERVTCRIRLDEIDVQLQRLADRREMLNFFENREHWEHEAKEKDELFEQFKNRDRGGQVADDEHVEGIFEKARAIGTVRKQQRK